MVAKRRRVALAAARKAAGYTQERLAAALPVDRSTVIRWEAGDHAPVPDLWPKLAKLLGVSAERLQELFIIEEVKPRNVLAPVPVHRDQHTITNPTTLLTDPTSWASDVNRRELLRLLGAASAEITVPQLLAGLNSDEQERVTHAVGVPSRVDELTIQHVESCCTPLCARTTSFAHTRLWIRSLLNAPWYGHCWQNARAVCDAGC